MKAEYYLKYEIIPKSKWSKSSGYFRRWNIYKRVRDIQLPTFEESNSGIVDYYDTYTETLVYSNEDKIEAEKTLELLKQYG